MSDFDQPMTDQAFILSAADFERLDTMASADSVSDSVRMLLRAKLANSTVQFGSDIPADIVTIGSRVQITPGTRAALDVIVGTDRRLPPAPGATLLELDTPLAIALLGCKAGMEVIAPRPDGFVETVRIEAVRAQPEATSINVAANVVSFTPRAAPRPASDLPDDPGPSAA